MLLPRTTNKSMEERERVPPAALQAHPPICHEIRQQRLIPIRVARKCWWPATPLQEKYVRRTRSWRTDRARNCRCPPEKSAPELLLQTNESAIGRLHLWIHLPVQRSKADTHVP